MGKSRRVRLEIYGRVQGVFYRASTREKADELGVNGWVRNRADGSVEALAEGDADAVAGLIDWAHEGPSRAQVERVEVTDEEFEGDLRGFKVRR